MAIRLIEEIIKLSALEDYRLKGIRGNCTVP
jgi:hypothetical protein